MIFINISLYKKSTYYKLNYSKFCINVHVSIFRTNTYPDLYQMRPVGAGGLQSGPSSIWAQGPCRGGILPRKNNRWPGSQGEWLRTYPVLGFPELQWEDLHLGGGYPQTVP